MDDSRRDTLDRLIAELDGVIMGLGILVRNEKAEVKRERRELGELCADQVDTEALEGLTDAIDELEIARAILDEI